MVTKAVIPAAGLGTRFLPGTKVLPKEILPVVDRPVLEYTVQEAVDSGVSEVVLVTSPGKELLARHFRPAAELEGYLEARGKSEMLQAIRTIGAGVRVTEVVQTRPLGLGHAVLTARGALGEATFAGLLPDDIIRAAEPVIAQMLRVHERHGCTVLAVRRVPIQSISRYGSIRVRRQEGRVYFIDDVVEKPTPEEAPSNLAVLGRYILTPGIFDALERTQPGAGGEIQLTDGVRNLLRDEPVVALEFEGDYFDVGTIPGFLKTSIAFGRARPEFRAEIESYLRELLDSPPEAPPPTG
ncbi:MAG: UTP--glucose-1-phosphate uridylyltransferase [Candidatus Dormibacteria bacterium]